MESVNFEQYEKSLAEAQFLGGQLPTNADREAYELVKSSAPTAASHPNTYAWFVLVGRFSDAIRATWGASQAAPAKGGDKKPAAKVEEKKEEPKPETKAAADDDMDLFGDDDDEEAQAALAELKKKKELEANAPPKKKGVLIAKSIILFDVKPYEAETNLDELAKKILAIQMDGVIWKTEYKKSPIAYGIEKLVVGCVIEDDKVMVDDLQAAMEAFEEEVQSVDIAVFNKI